MSSSTRRAAIRLITLLALVAACARAAWSGVYVPFDHPNLGKFDEEAYPLREHLMTGAPVHSRNPAQYGPVFFLVMHPLLRAQPDPSSLAAWLYALQLACIAIAFGATCAALKWTLAPDPDLWPLLIAWLAIVWLNFSPLYTVVAQKSVETWELALVAVALAAHLRCRRRTAAAAVACAGLIKVLPLAFVYYWLVTNRRTFVYACAVIVALLVVGELLYGHEMGIGYLPRLVSEAAGNSYGLGWHENVSLKAAIAKLFGHLPSPSDDAARTSGYFLALDGWRRAAAIVLGDAAVVGGVALLTATWLRRARSNERWLWEWSVLTVAVLILSPNTIFEYLTLALGAISYAFARLVLARRWTIATSTFAMALLLVGGLAPRQWLNRLLAIDVWKDHVGLAHLTASEAYQYACVPLLGLLLLLASLWQLQPAEAPPGN